jgi:hypothetical protein
LWRTGGVAPLDSVVEHDTVVVVHDLALVAELDGAPEPAAFAIGRASESRWLTRRVAPSGVVADSR